MLDAIDPGAREPQNRVQSKEPEGEAHHDDEVPPHAVEQGIALGVVMIGMGFELREAFAGVGVALLAGLHDVGGTEFGCRFIDLHHIVRPMTIAAPGGTIDTQRRYLPVVAHPVGVVEGERALASLARLVVAGAAFFDDVELEDGRVGAGDAVCGVAIAANGGGGVALGKHSSVDAGSEDFGDAGVTGATCLGDVYTVHG